MIKPATRLDYVVEALERLDENVDVAVLASHALLIHRVMSDLVAAQRSRGVDIGCDDKDISSARPRLKTVGLARELFDLARKCRKAVAGKISLNDWTTIWAAQPERVSPRVRALWRPVRNRSIDLSQIARTFKTHADPSEAKGDYFHTIVPKPEIALPLIEAALREITANPNAKTRKRDKYEADAIAATRAAYRAITGNTGGRVIRDGKLVGKLDRLRREVDCIFGTKLFAARDSRRFR
jgi:hypothetical protein